MRSWATRSTNLYGPAHTGLLANAVPAALAALGETIMPARSASWASSGADGLDRLNRTVCGSTTSTPVISLISDLRRDSGRVSLRSMLYFTASASNGSPSWNLTPWRKVKVIALLSSLHFHAVASCGWKASLAS